MSPILIIMGVCAVLGGVIGRVRGASSGGNVLNAARGAIVGLLLGVIGAIVYDRNNAPPLASDSSPAAQPASTD